jgi:hypothetical protein
VAYMDCIKREKNEMNAFSPTTFKLRLLGISNSIPFNFLKTTLGLQHFLLDSPQ